MGYWAGRSNIWSDKEGDVFDLFYPSEEKENSIYLLILILHRIKTQQ